MQVYTIGYGGRSIDDFIALLRQYAIDILLDARSLPTSRFQPNFRKKALEEHLNSVGIRYVYVGNALGGKRVDSEALVDGKLDLNRLFDLPNFRDAISQAAELASAAAQHGAAAVFMCAERRPEACHRAWMLAPQMQERGFEVLHIDESGGLKTHSQVMKGIQDA